jgi:hypothetical protein
MKHGFPMTHVQTEVPDDDVQTDVPDDEYERLRAIADERGDLHSGGTQAGDRVVDRTARRGRPGRPAFQLPRRRS